MLFFRIVPRNFLRQETKHESVFNFFLLLLSQKHLIALLLFIRFFLVSISNHFAQFQSFQELYEFYSDGVCITCNDWHPQFNGSF